MANCEFKLKILVILSCLTVFPKESCAAQPHVGVADLIKDLLADYDPDARPVKNISQAVVITINFLFIQLQDLEEPRQVVKSLIGLNMYWHDDFLMWNASKYGGSSAIHLDPSRIWTPDITLYNNARQDNNGDNKGDFKAIVSSEGDVDWYSLGSMQSVCPMEISKFPFDTQKCEMKLGSWTQHGEDIDLKPKEDTQGISLYLFKENSEWEFKSAHAERNVLHYSCCPEPFVDITYHFEFRRKPLYYVMTIVFPAMLLSLLSCISFCFPAGSGERVSLVISVLLGLVVFMLIVNERTPVTSDTVPMITQIFNSIGASTVLVLMATAFILRLNHVSAMKPVPRWLVRIRNCIAVALCMRRKKESTKQVLNNFDAIHDNESFVPEFDPGALEEQRTPIRRHLPAEESILKELRKFSRHLEAENITSEIREDWQYTMRVFDRFFFCLFFVKFLLFSAYVLCVYLTS